MKLYLVTGILVAAGLFYWLFDESKMSLVSPALAMSACSFDQQMVRIPGGKFDMGAGAIYPEEYPVVQRHVDDFLISKYEVTNAEFADFVEETGYVTVAERVPDPALYPNIPEEDLKAGSAVFVKLDEAVKAATFLNWWHFVEGANWQSPAGPGSNITGKDNYPVIHIAYEDAISYAEWKGHRLPTEEEFEYASRSGLNGKKYATGETLQINGQYQSNTWQGLFPFNDSGEDGFVGLAPVGCFNPNDYGVHDLIGNVWEWTSTRYYPRHIADKTEQAKVPPNGYDPRQPGVNVGVVKGGSYLCADDFCMRYRPAARHAQDTGMGTSHIGFRTAKDISDE